MEKSENRDLFLKQFPEFVDKIKLSDKFFNSIARHQYFKNYVPLFKNFQTPKEKATFILLEMTRERASCAAIIELLRNDGQDEIANRLENLNTSKGPWPLSESIEIKVTPVTTPKMNMSNCYTLIAKKRGLCVIINNVEVQQNPDVYSTNGHLDHKPKGLKNETERFKSVFTQLFFEVIVLKNLSADEIKKSLIKIREQSVDEKDEAFVLVVISHGENDKVIGYNASEEMRKIRFEMVNANLVQEQIKSDAISIKEIVAIFSENNCRKLISKPKLHFFICNRDNNSFEDNLTVKQKEYYPLTLDTFICYSCPKNYGTFYDTNWGMTYFGQALTHSIAQYACDESLNSIMARTSTRLRNMYRDKKQTGSIEEMQPNSSGSFAFEVNTYSMRRELYFNPGYYQKDE